MGAEGWAADAGSSIKCSSNREWERQGGYLGALVRRTWCPPVRAGHPQGGSLLVGTLPLLAGTHHSDSEYSLKLNQPVRQA